MSLCRLSRAHYSKYASTHILPSPASLHYLTIRTLRTTPPGSKKVDNLTQGHATNPKDVHPQDVQSQSVRGGLRAKKDENNESIDAANEVGKAGEKKRPGDMGKGNPEKIGFVEQVGGASASARKFEREERKKE